MGGDDSQKLLPWSGGQLPSRAQTSGSHYEINNVAETADWNLALSLLLVNHEMASATARLGHFWKALVGQFCRAPKPDDPNRRCIRYGNHPGPHQTFVSEWYEGEKEARRRPRAVIAAPTHQPKWKHKRNPFR